MAKVKIKSRLTIGTAKGRTHLEAGEQEVSSEIEKALVDAGVIEKKATAKQEK